MVKNSTVGFGVAVLVLLVLIAAALEYAGGPAAAPAEKSPLAALDPGYRPSHLAMLLPWDPDSRQQLETAALAAGGRGAHWFAAGGGGVNPVSRIGATSRVRGWENPYIAADDPRAPCAPAVGDLAPAARDSTDGGPTAKRYYFQPPYWSRVAGPYGGPYRPLAACGAQ